MDEKLVHAIKTLYDQRVLTPRFGKGSFRKDLLNGLEKVLKDIEPVTNIPKPVIEDQVLDLDRKIDYESLEMLELELRGGVKKYAGNAITRLRNVFCGEKIETYRDLVNYARNQYEKGKLKNMYGHRVLNIRHMGIVVSTTLYIHLDSISINLFPDGYRPQELGKHGQY